MINILVKEGGSYIPKEIIYPLQGEIGKKVNYSAPSGLGTNKPGDKVLKVL